MSIKHLLNANPGAVLGSADWNAAHTFDGTAGKLLGADGAEIDPSSLTVTATSSGLSFLFTTINGASIPSSVTVIETAGHTVAGVGGAKYKYDAGVTALNVGVGGNIGTAFLASDGRGFRLDEKQWLSFEMFGAIPGDYATGLSATCNPAWDRWTAWVQARPRNSFGSLIGGPSLHFAGAQYYFDATIQNKVTAHYSGMGNGYSGGAPTMFRFAANIAGFVNNRSNTLGDVEQTPATTGGDGTLLERVYLFGGGGTPDLLKSGIRMRARMTVRDCLVGSFAGAGVCIVADTSTAISNPYYGNTNNWRLDNVRVQYNKYGGAYCSGGDANAGLSTYLDASQNARYGILDAAFLGNTWVGPHTDANGNFAIAGGLAETAQVTDGTHRYYLKHGQDALASTTPPTFGTSNAVWLYLGPGGTHPNIPLYGTGGVTYVSGGAYYQAGSANLGTFLSPYYETGQAPPQLVGSGLSINGFMPKGDPLGAPQITTSIGKGIASQRQFTQTVTFGDGTLGSVAVGGVIVGNVASLLTFESALAFPSNPGFPAHLKYDGPTGDVYWDCHGLRQPFRWNGYSTVRAYQGRPLAENRFITEIDTLALGNGLGSTPNDNLIVRRGTAAPTTGTWGRGDMIINTGAATSINLVDYWRCTVAGTPGTWVAGGKTSNGPAVGYATGAGGTVTQTGSKSTSVSLNKPTGQITTMPDALAAGASVSFLLSNTLLVATDLLIVNIASGATANSYSLTVTSMAGSAARIQIHNFSAGSLSEALVINFAIIKGIAA